MSGVHIYSYIVHECIELKIMYLLSLVPWVYFTFFSTRPPVHFGDHELTGTRKMNGLPQLSYYVISALFEV